MKPSDGKIDCPAFFRDLYFPLTAFLILSPTPASFAQSNAQSKQTWQQVLVEAKKEGRVVVWGPPGELIREAMTQGFKKDFPSIVIEYSGARGGEQATRIKAERDGGVYSVDVMLSGTTTAMNQMKPMKALDPIAPILMLPEVTDLKNWRDNKLEFSDETTRLNLVFSTMVSKPRWFIIPNSPSPRRSMSCPSSWIPNGKENLSSTILCLRAQATSPFAGSGALWGQKRPKTITERSAPTRRSRLRPTAPNRGGFPRVNTLFSLRPATAPWGSFSGVG